MSDLLELERARREAPEDEALRRRWSSTLSLLGQDPPVPIPGMLWKHLPPGVFKMGSPEDEVGRYADEAQREIVVDYDYWIADICVSKTQWIAGGGREDVTQAPSGAVTSVSWDDAVEWCQRLSEKWPGWEFRLPYEVEWERAAKLACPDNERDENWLGNVWQWQQDAYRPDGPRLPLGCCAVVPGSTMPGSVAWPSGSGTIPRIGARSSDSDSQEGEDEGPDPTGRFAAAPGATSRSTCARRFVTGTILRVGSSASVSDSQGEEDDRHPLAVSCGVARGTTMPRTAARPSVSASRPSPGTSTTDSGSSEREDERRPFIVASEVAPGTASRSTCARPTASATRPVTGSSTSVSDSQGEEDERRPFGVSYGADRAAPPTVAVAQPNERSERSALRQGYNTSTSASESSPRDRSVLRGGSRHYAPIFLRSSFRHRFDPTLRFNNIGFRVVAVRASGRVIK